MGITRPRPDGGVTSKNLNWPEADQLAIYKHSRGVELGTTGWECEWERECMYM